MTNAIINPQFYIMKQKTRKIHTKIHSLDNNDNIVGQISGYCIDGNLQISNQDMVRRSINMSFVANSKLELSQKSPFWINKRLQVFTGVDDYKGNTHWYNHGIFVPNQIDTSTLISGRTISFSGMDKMCLADNPVTNMLSIPTGTKIAPAIKMLAQLYGETKFISEDLTHSLPYTYEILIGDSIQEAIKEIVNLYMNYDVYYNTSGYLVYEKQKNRINDAPMWIFKNSDDFTIQRKISADFSKIFNDFKVFGHYDDKTAKQPTYQLTITDNKHPFSVKNMGRKHSMVIEEDTYTTVEQCKIRAEFEKKQAENLINNFSITTVPIYQLNEVNKVIKLMDNEKEYTCLVDTINYPFNINSPMSIGCHEIFV